MAVIQGKLPTTPATFNHDAVMGTGQARYVSFCMNESAYSTKVMDCVYDEEVPVDKDGNYTIVTSYAKDKPKTATTKYGVSWIEWSPTGDGYQDPDFGWFQIRNMLPDVGFNNAVQNTLVPGDEVTAMGDYLPNVQYMSEKQFDKWIKKQNKKHDKKH